MSPSGSSIRVWGPAGWSLIHASAWNYPLSDPTKEEREDFFALMWAVARTLPCRRCREHAKEYLVSHLPSPDSPPLRTRNDLFAFTVRFHNEVNLRTGKPTVEVEEASLYQRSGSSKRGKERKSLSSAQSGSKTFLLLTLLLLSSTYLWTRRRNKGTKRLDAEE